MNYIDFSKTTHKANPTITKTKKLNKKQVLDLVRKNRRLDNNKEDVPKAGLYDSSGILLRELLIQHFKTNYTSSNNLPQSLNIQPDDVYKIIFPENIENIPQYSFYKCSNLTEINIPQSITSVSDYAFYGCNSITSLYIHKDLSSIGTCAFVSMTSLESIVVDSENTTFTDNDTNLLSKKGYSTILAGCKNSEIPYGFYDIPDLVFSNLTLKDFVIPDSVTTISSESFTNCTFEGSFRISSRLRFIGKSAFMKSNITITTLPSSVITIEDFAFCDCNSIESITLSSSLKKIGMYAFYNCRALKNAVISDTTYMGTDVFRGCSSLETAEIKSGSFIPSSAFRDCAKLTNIIVSDSVKEIRNHAFDGCESLLSFTIGSNVEYIAPGAFYRCAKLTSVIFEDTEGWHETPNQSGSGGVMLDLTSPSENAKYLTNMYDNHYWFKR